MEAESTFLDNYQLTGQILPIIKYPAAVLKKKAAPVTKFDQQLKQTCKDMLYTMYKSPGIGLAAPQIGISQRFFVLDIDYQREEINNIDGDVEYRLSDFNPQIFINPIIKNPHGEITYEEGCLSVPGIFENVTRPNFVTVEYQNLSGEHLEMDVEETFAVCIQHENDHLNGVVFLERLSMLKRNFLRKKYLKSRIK